MALTIRPSTEAEIKLIEDIKLATNNSSASKALLDAATIVVNRVPEMKEKIKELKSELEEIKNSNADLFAMVQHQLALTNELKMIDTKIKNAIKTKSGS